LMLSRARFALEYRGLPLESVWGAAEVLHGKAFANAADGPKNSFLH
jgi:hypothetical protein